MYVLRIPAASLSILNHREDHGQSPLAGHISDIDPALPQLDHTPMKKTLSVILSLFLIFSGLTASALGMTAIEDFTAPQIVPAKGIEDYYGQWELYGTLSTTATGAEQMIPYDKNDPLLSLLSMDLDISEEHCFINVTGNKQSAECDYEFNPDDGSLVTKHDGEVFYVFNLHDNGMISYTQETEGDK